MALTATQQMLAPSIVLIASSNAGFRNQVLMRLRQQPGPQLAEAAEGGADALAQMELRHCRYVLLDTRLADLDPLEIAGLLRASDPGVEVLLVDSEAAQPLCPGQSMEDPALRRICEIFEHDLSAEAEAAPALADSLPEAVLAPLAPSRSPWATAASPAVTAQPVRATAVPATPLPLMIGESDAMAQVYRNVRLVAKRTTSVLLTGESGTGKELVAHAIHQISPRAAGPFVVVNCAAIPDQLLESELFGYSRGAFTGAVQSKLGRVHAAHGGTLFLDEIGELPLNLQAKLLRFLQEGEIQRLGSADMIRVEARVVAATNADLKKRIQEGTFRRDLYYRLSVFPVELPLLKDRHGDIIDLARHFLSIYCRAGNQAQKQLSPASIEALEAHDWPGNVRELQHSIERAVILADDDLVVEPRHLSIGA